MSPALLEELATLCRQWRARAAGFMTEAERKYSSGDIVRLTAMSSTLDFCARDLACVIDARCRESPNAALTSDDKPQKQTG